MTRWSSNMQKQRIMTALRSSRARRNKFLESWCATFGNTVNERGAFPRTSRPNNQASINEFLSPWWRWTDASENLVEKKLYLVNLCKNLTNKQEVAWGVPIINLSVARSAQVENWEAIRISFTRILKKPKIPKNSCLKRFHAQGIHLQGASETLHHNKQHFFGELGIFSSVFLCH